MIPICADRGGYRGVQSFRNGLHRFQKRVESGCIALGRGKYVVLTIFRSEICIVSRPQWLPGLVLLPT